MLFTPYKVYLCQKCISDLKKQHSYPMPLHEMAITEVSSDICDKCVLSNEDTILKNRNKLYRPLPELLTELAKMKFEDIKSGFIELFIGYHTNLLSQNGSDVEASLNNILLSTEQCDSQTQKTIAYFVDEYRRTIEPPLAATSDDIVALKQRYPVGSRVELVRMNDPLSKLNPGDMGTIRGVDDAGNIMVNWDIGSSLNVLFNIDEVKKLK